MTAGVRGALGAAACVPVWLLAAAGSALAAEPTPTPVGGDPRSPGEGPGFVGDPLLAIGVVLMIALLAVVVTTAWVRLTGPRTPDRSNRG